MLGNQHRWDQIMQTDGTLQKVGAVDSIRYPDGTQSNFLLNGVRNQALTRIMKKLPMSMSLKIG